MEPHLNIESITAVFFKGMSAGWVGNVPETTLPGLPGSKAIDLTFGDFRFLDLYFHNNSPESDGSTMIWHQNILVWTMHCGGKYDPIAIPFLKSCLKETYTNQRFNGGRGPRVVQGEHFRYENKTEINSDFRRFRGEEYVLDRTGSTEFGYHTYQGGLLINQVGL